MAGLRWEKNYSRNYDLSNPNTMKVIIIILLVISMILLGGSLYAYMSTTEFLKSADTAEGVVLKLIPVEGDETTYAPVFGFKDRSGESHVIESSSSSNPPAFERGEKIEVIYDPEKPQNARINSFFNLWGGAVILGIVGIFFLIFGLIFYVIKKKSIGLKSER